MNKIFVLMVLVMMSSVVSAMACHEQVHVEDNLGNNMVGVGVQLTADCKYGLHWGPGNDNTISTGWTKNWEVSNYCTYTATVPNPPEGYSCEYKSTSGPHINTGDQGYHYLVCTPDNDVPEFSMIAAGVAFAGAGAGYLFLRRKN